ncbi:MAG: GNAT family N-acetyltransferase [Anditalea sp.]
MSIEITAVKSKEDLEGVFKIRETVFVIEQEVSPEEEYDEFEEISTHFLAKIDGEPAGTARWRHTADGIKLERFAVLKPMRGKGVGEALVKAVLEDISAHEIEKGKILYLHAQLPAVSLYEKFGFLKEGEIFMECGIAHYSMKRTP